MSAASFRFVSTDAGYVEIVRSEERPAFTDVLNDCIGTRAPRGAPSGLSTYWIDETLKVFRPHLSGSEASAIFSGNASYLELVDGLVEARFDYDPPDSDVVERLPLHELVDLLEAWRIEVIRLDPTAATRMPPPRPAITLGPAVDDEGDAALRRGEFVEVDRLTLVSRVGWIKLMSPTFVRAGERYRADWGASTVIVQRLDGTQHTFEAKPSGPDSIR